MVILIILSALITIPAAAQNKNDDETFGKFRTFQKLPHIPKVKPSRNSGRLQSIKFLPIIYADKKHEPRQSFT